ncbi:hypothetical protein [Shewanella sp.]|uniref:hypothetical protein n=1 Tax=Shewanella sp. TaxID=50422 RepID=UPI004053F67B
MNNAIKAALLSAFICPGSGQWWLKQRLVGGGFMLVSVICLGYLILEVMERAQAIAAKILSGEIANDLVSIYAEVSAIPTEAMATMSLLTWVFIANWLLSIIHAYWLGTQADKTVNSD